MKHTHKLLALAVLVACAVAACGDGSDNGGLPVIPPGPLTPPVDPNTDYRINFTENDNWKKLGLLDGINVKDEMDGRWNKAQTVDTGYRFYPVSSFPSVTDINVAGENLDGCGIHGGNPQMIFLLKGTKLYVWGVNGDYGYDRSISFDIAIIDDSGVGWLNQKVNGTAYEDLWYNYPDSYTKEYPLSDLTPGIDSISNISGLSGYSVYIIVRNTSARTTVFGPDFNLQTSSAHTMNVIVPTIR